MPDAGILAYLRLLGVFRAAPGGYKAAMDKLQRDRRGEIYQDELTENQSTTRPSRREEAEKTRQMDPNVDSQEGDEAMAQDRFGNERKGEGQDR